MSQTRLNASATNETQVTPGTVAFAMFGDWNDEQDGAEKIARVTQAHATPG